MPHAIRIRLEIPDDLASLQLPDGVQERLLALLDRQDQGQVLRAAERREAEGLVELADPLSLLRLGGVRLVP